MAKAKNPINVSTQFSIDPSVLDGLGVLNATVAIDTRLFIDPILLEKSAHQEFNTQAIDLYRKFFEELATLLEASKNPGDVAWKAAYRKFNFPEIPGTCLGYGAATIRGRGWGPKLRTRALGIAKEIVDLGIRNPDLFTVLALFEEKIGPDLISDMVTHVIAPALVNFNVRVLTEMELHGEGFELSGVKGIFLVNPFEPSQRTPIILVPVDILRELPVAVDWDCISDAAAANEKLRLEVSQSIGEIWASKNARDKAALKAQALANKDAFITLLSAVRNVSPTQYDVNLDPEGLIHWSEVGNRCARMHSMSAGFQAHKNVEDVAQNVRRLIEQYSHLIERCGLNKELYREDGSHKHESSAQRLFFSSAYWYCKYNNIDISPEIDTGNGKLDFKFSVGFEARVLVEIKLSTNSKVVSGFENQLEEYKVAQETTRAFYVVLNVGQMGTKDDRLIQLANERRKAGEPVSEIIFIDASIKLAPSKR